MVCPLCGGNNLSAKMKFVRDPYDFSKHKEIQPPKGGSGHDIQARYFAEQKLKDEMAANSAEPTSEAPSNCPLCGYSLRSTWKFCPECGVSLTKK
jgi:rubrerythrin